MLESIVWGVYGDSIPLFPAKKQKVFIALCSGQHTLSLVNALKVAGLAFRVHGSGGGIPDLGRARAEPHKQCHAEPVP